MSKFPLRTKELRVEGIAVRIRELTFGEREEISGVPSAEAPSATTALILARGCEEPKLTAEEWCSEAPGVVMQVSREILELSGIKFEPAASGAPLEKEPNAGADISVSSGSGVGSSSK